MARLPKGVTVVRQELRPGYLDVTLAFDPPEGQAAQRDDAGPDDQAPVRIICSAHSPVRLGRRLPASGPYLETTDASEALAFFLRHYRDYRNCVVAVLDSPEDTRCRSSVAGSCDCPRCSGDAGKG